MWLPAALRGGGWLSVINGSQCTDTTEKKTVISQDLVFVVLCSFYIVWGVWRWNTDSEESLGPEGLEDAVVLLCRLQWDRL